MAEPEIPGLDAFCRAIAQGDDEAINQYRKEFVSRNWPFVRMLDQLAHADFGAGRFDTAAQKLQLLEQLLPDVGGIFVRRVGAALQAGDTGALEELATGAERLRQDSDLVLAVEQLLLQRRPDIATSLIEAACAAGRFSTSILAACRSRVMAATGRFGEALRSLDRETQEDEFSITANRCRYELLEQLLEYEAAQRIALRIALQLGEEHELRHAFEQLMFAFQYDAAENLASAFVSRYPARKSAADTLSVQIGPARAALAAAIAEHGAASSDASEIFAALSEIGTPPARVLWGKVSLINFLRSGAITEADYVLLAWFLPNWEQAAVRNRVLAAARKFCGDAPAVQRGWLHYLITLCAYGDAARHCRTLRWDAIDEDTLFFVIALLRLQHDRIVPDFMDTTLFETLRADVFARMPSTGAGFRCVMHDHVAVLGGDPNGWPQDALPPHDSADAVGFRRLFAVKTGRLARISTTSRATCAGPIRPVLAMSGQLRGFETAWASINARLCQPTNAPVILTVWDKSVNATGRHAGRLERALPADIIARLKPEERYTDIFEKTYPKTYGLLFGQTDVDAASLRTMLDGSDCNLLAVETESEGAIGRLMHPHVSPNMLKMYYKFARVEGLIRDAEIQSGDMFSHVIWSRPDCDILRLSPADLRACLGRADLAWSSFVTETSFGDYVMVLPRRAFAAIAAIFPRVVTAGGTRLMPWRPNRSVDPTQPSHLDAFGGPDVLFDILLAEGYLPWARIPRTVVRLLGRTPAVGDVRRVFAAEAG